MAVAPSPANAIHFRLSSGTSGIICSLGVNDESSTDNLSLPLLDSTGKKGCQISFNVCSEAQNQEEARRWLQDNLEKCSVRAIEDPGDGSVVEPSEQLQTMVKKLANLWANSPTKNQKIYIARPSSASSSRTGSTTSLALPTPRPPFANRASRQSTLSTSTSSNSLSGSERDGVFYLQMRPGTTDSALTTRPGTAESTPSAKSDRRSYFDDQLLARLHTLDWQEQQEDDKKPKDLIMPTRPLDIYVPPGRAPSPNPDTPDSSRPASPSVITEDPRAATVTPALPAAPADALQVPAKSRAWELISGEKVSSIDKPITVVTPSDQSTIILPSPPRDDEKYLYAQTRRAALYVFGTFSFLSVSVGMWFFAISSRQFYWFGVFVGLIQIYLIISYVVGYFGRDFNVDEHKKLVEEHSYPPEAMPLVDIYLPCCKEPLEILENTYKYVAQLDYPNFKVHVLDDGGLDSVKRLAEAYNFNYMSRDNKPHLKKAGNLRYAFARTEGDFFVIYDADFCPRADFLKETLPYMKKYEDIAIVQSPQFFRPSGDQTWVEQGASATQELFYRVVQVNRDRWNAAICVGSNAVYRRAALAEVGGTAEIGHSEDVHTGFYAATRGWRLKYIPLGLACGVSPDTPQAFFSQQMRWCAGSTTLLTNPDFWKSKLTIIQKVCFLSGMMYYTAAALMIFLVPLPGLLMIWLKPSLVMWFNFAYAFPSLIYSVIIFRLWSRQMYNFNVNFVFIIQQYAYLMAVKDRILGTTASWVPSGDTQSHVKGEKKKKAGGNNKYRNMRILCCVWVWGTTGGMIAGVTVRMVQGHHWYNFLPLILLDLFTVFITHKFIFYSR